MRLLRNAILPLMIGSLTSCSKPMQTSERFRDPEYEFGRFPHECRTENSIVTIAPNCVCTAPDDSFAIRIRIVSPKLAANEAMVNVEIRMNSVEQESASWVAKFPLRVERRKGKQEFVGTIKDVFSKLKKSPASEIPLSAYRVDLTCESKEIGKAVVKDMPLQVAHLFE